MAETCVMNNCKQENETLFKRIKAAGKKQITAVTLIAFAAGFTVGRCYDDGEEAVVMPDLREVGFEAFISSFLCCIASIISYIVIRREATSSTWKIHDISMFSLVLALAALTFVLRMYAVLTLTTYTHLWIAGAAVGLVGFVLFGFVIYVRAYRLALGIGLASIVGHLFYPSQTLPHDTQNSN